jgi:hypothetical protein
MTEGRMYGIQRVMRTDYRRHASTFSKLQQVPELAKTAQRGPEYLELANEDATKIGGRLVTGRRAAGNDTPTPGQ